MAVKVPEVSMLPVCEGNVIDGVRQGGETAALAAAACAAEAKKTTVLPKYTR